MRVKVAKLVKQSLALLAVFVLFQTEAKPHGIPETPIKRGAWARTLQLGDGKDLLELNDGYLITAGTPAVRLQCSRRN